MFLSVVGRFNQERRFSVNQKTGRRPCKNSVLLSMYGGHMDTVEYT